MRRSGLKCVTLALLMTGMTVCAQADVIRVELSFDEPIVRVAGSGVRVEAKDCATFNDPGLPLLPAREAVVLIPPGEKVRAIRVYPSTPRELEGRYGVIPAETPQPISRPGPFAPTEPNPAVYGSDALYPDLAAVIAAEQIGWGHGLAFVRVRPVAYRPLSGRLIWYERIAVEIETALPPNGSAREIENLRTGGAVDAWLAAHVVNPQDLPGYANAVARKSEGSRLDPDFYPYVIITSDEFAPVFHPLAAYESSRGLRAKVMPLSEIAAWPGDDTPMKMRNFVIDAYQNWQTDFIVLGGDFDIVPVRNLYVDAGGTIDQFPGDCYYEALDGNWNGDGDELWGEEGEYDLVGEVAAGRVSVSSPDEFARWFHKNVMYAEAPVVAEVEKALFLGERMDDYPTWGGRYMDEVKDYSCAHGYCTSGYPDTYLKQTLYDSPTYTWSKWELIAQFNGGFPTNHHLGHAGTTYGMRMDNADVQYLTNDGIRHSYLIPYTQGCYSNNFDNGGVDAISEVFLADDHGAAAFMGNTRYGWYVIGGTGGPSQHYNRQFVDARYSEGITTIGWMNVDSKVDNIWQMNPWNLWCHYELCLLGDPALEQWNTVRGELELAHAGGFVLGQTAYDVVVTCEGTPVEGATVALVSDDLTVWSGGATDGAGRVTLTPNPAAPMTLALKAVKTDYLPGSDDVVVAPTGTPWLVCSAAQIEDDSAWPSIGDGDGLADLGETLELSVALHNIGEQDALNAELTLTCSDARVEVIDGSAAYGTIAPFATGWNLDDLVVRVASDVADGDSVDLDFTFACDQRWSGSDAQRIGLHAPILSVESYVIADRVGGDGDGRPEPGESFTLRVTLANSGSDEGRDVVGILDCSNMDLTILEHEAEATLVPCGGTSDLAPPYEARLSITTPTEDRLNFTLSATTWAGQTFALAFEMPVGSFFEDEFETDLGWTAGVASDDAAAGFWERVDPVGSYISGHRVQTEDDHSPSGTVCFVTAQASPGTPAMYNDVDGGKTTLISPVFDLRDANHPALVYWRWYTNNLGPYPNQDYWKVAVSSDGGMTWVPLENTTVSEAYWRRMSFALEDYIPLTDRVKVRFVASDYGGESLVEAAVDDFSIESLIDPTGIEGGGDMRPPRDVVFGLGPIHPNPLIRTAAGGAGGQSRAFSGVTIQYGVPAAGAVSLRLFGIDGALMRTLVEAPQAPGLYRVIWDGRDNDGRVLASGFYFCRLEAAGKRAQGKIVVLR